MNQTHQNGSSFGTATTHACAIREHSSGHISFFDAPFGSSAAPCSGLGLCEALGSEMTLGQSRAGWSLLRALVVVLAWGRARVVVRADRARMRVLSCILLV